LAGGVVERPLTTEPPALLAAHVCKAGALFGVAEGELVSNGAGGLSLSLTYVPEGELLTGFAMRSDPNVVFISIFSSLVLVCVASELGSVTKAGYH